MNSYLTITLSHSLRVGSRSHMDMSFLPARIDDLETFLNLLNINFEIICILSRLSTKPSPTTNISIPGYNIEQAPTESTARDKLIYYLPKTFT